MSPIPLGIFGAARSAPVVIPPAETHSARVMALTPGGYWKLDETSGTAMNDSSGNARHGTYSGAVLAEPALHPDSPRSARGTAAGVGVGSVPSAAWMEHSNTYSISGWVKVNTTGDAVGLLSRYVSGSGWVVWQRSGRLSLTVINQSGQQNSFGPTFSVGTTYHLAMVHDGSFVRLYVNGVEVIVARVNNTYSTVARDLQIGGYGGTNYSSATFSDVAYWARALSPEEVGYIYDGASASVLPIDPAGVAGLKGRYDAHAVTGLADGAAIATWPDTSGNNKHLTASGTAQPLFKTIQHNGHPVVRFDGTDDFCSVATPFTSFFNSLTVIALFRPRTTTSLQVPYAVEGSGNQGTAMAINASGVRAIFAVGTFINYTGGTIPANAFELSALVARDVAVGTTPTNGTALYANGTVVHADQRISQNAAPATLSIGKSIAQGFPAPIDVAELLLFDRPLSGRQIRGIGAFLTAKWAQAPKVLLVRGSGAVGSFSGDLTSLGYAVTETTATTAAGLDTAWGEGHDIIIVAATENAAAPAWAATKWAAGVPCLFGGWWTGSPTLGVYYGMATAETESLVAGLTMDVGTTPHPVAAGFSGNVTVTTSTFYSNRLTAGVRGTTVGTFNGSVLTAVNAGEAIHTGASHPGSPGATAPARAIFMGWATRSVTLTADGRKILDQAMKWLRGA